MLINTGAVNLLRDTSGWNYHFYLTAYKMHVHNSSRNKYMLIYLYSKIYSKISRMKEKGQEQVFTYLIWSFLNKFITWDVQKPWKYCALCLAKWFSITMLWVLTRFVESMKMPMVCTWAEVTFYLSPPHILGQFWTHKHFPPFPHSCICKTCKPGFYVVFLWNWTSRGLNFSQCDNK